MIPSPWVGVVLALAAYRLVRLAGWDTFPLAVKARRWATGEYLTRTTSYSGLANRVRVGADDPPPDVDRWRDVGPAGGPVELPDEAETEYEVGYARPTLAHLLACPFCLGAWASLAVYGCWLAFPTGTLYAAVPLALSAVVGLLAKNWDA